MVLPGVNIERWLGKRLWLRTIISYRNNYYIIIIFFFKYETNCAGLGKNYPNFINATDEHISLLGYPYFAGLYCLNLILWYTFI